MADLYCSLLESRSFTNFSLLIWCRPPPKAFSTLYFHPSHHPRRRRRKALLSLHLPTLSNPFLPTPSSSNFDLISTSECSDGSFMFRFGDSSQLARNVELEEGAGASVVERESNAVGAAKLESNDILLDDTQEIEVPASEDALVTADIEVCDSFSSGSGSGSGLSLSMRETVHCEDDSIGNNKDDISSPVIVYVSDNSSKVENNVLGEAIEEQSNGGILNPSSYCKSDSVFEAHSSYALPESEKEHLSENEKDHIMKGTLEHRTDENGAEVAEIEAIPVSASVEPEQILYEKTSSKALEELIDTNSIESSIMLSENAFKSVSEAERTNGDTLSNDLAEVYVSEAEESRFSEAAADREEISTTGFLLSSGAALLPHPAKALTGKEDAYFVGCRNWLGVADGIGRWSLEGVTPGFYARELMENCEKIVSDCSSTAITDPEEVLSRSVMEAESSELSTVLVAHFNGQALHVANIGDSGFIILRNGAIYKRSSPMFHEFNFPLLIGRGDDPSELVEVYRIDLDEGDIIITATDGLFDNLYEQEIASIVSKSLQDNLNPKEIAQVLSERAQEVGKSPYARSPFADAAKAAGYIGYSGGKLDEVAVIVSLVQKEVCPQAVMTSFR